MRLGPVKKTRLLGNKNSDSHEENVNERPSGNTLRSMNIPLQVVPNDDVYSSSDIDHIEFQTSRPEGYYYGHVDEFVSSVKQSLSWYESALVKRNKDLHAVVEQLDATTLSLIELQSELDEIHSQGGVFVTQSADEPDTTSLQDKIAELEGEVTRLTRSLADYENWVKEAEAEKAETDKWIEQANAYIQDLEANQQSTPETSHADDQEELELLKAQVAELQAISSQNENGEESEEIAELRMQVTKLSEWIDEAEPYIQSLEQENTSLKSQPDTPQSLDDSQESETTDDTQNLNEYDESSQGEDVDLEALYAWIEEANEYIGNLETQNQELRAGITVPAEEQGDLSDRLKETLAELSTQRDQNAKLRQALQDKDELIAANEAYIASLSHDDNENDESLLDEAYEDDEAELEIEAVQFAVDVESEEDETEDYAELPDFEEEDIPQEETYALPDEDDAEEDFAEEPVIKVIGDEQSTAFLPVVTPEEEEEQEEEFENLLIEMLDRGPEHEIPLDQLHTEGDYLK